MLILWVVAAMMHIRPLLVACEGDISVMNDSGAMLTSPRYPLALARTSKPLFFFFDFACGESA